MPAGGSLGETMCRADLSMGVRITQRAAVELLLEHGWRPADIRRELRLSRGGLRALLAAAPGQHADRS